MRVLTAVVCAMAAGSAAGATLTRIHEGVRVPAGWAQTEEAVDRSAVMEATVGLRRQNLNRLQSMLESVSDPSGKNYLAYPTYEALGDMVRPTAEHTARVMEWLHEGGATVTKTHPHGDYIQVQATVGALERMAHGRFVTFTHLATGTRIARMIGGVSVPSAVAEAVEVFAGFHGFPLEPKQPKAVSKAEIADPVQVNPALLRKTYNITAVPRTKKNIQAIAQFQGQYVRQQDLSNFCNKFDNGKNCTITRYIGKNGIKPGLESMLDTEYIMSVSDTAETWVYSYPNIDFCADLIKFGDDVTGESEYPTVMSISYGSQFIGECDKSVMDRFNTDVQKMGTMGITVLIASGDDGSGGQTRQGSNGGKLSPSFPASVPYCTAVGSTFFVNQQGGEEEATTQFGSGGGFSYDFGVPSFQSSAVSEYLGKVKKPNAQYAQNGRGSPDVSALGEMFAVVDLGLVVEIGGTSASTPTFAAMVTLLNDACLAASGKTLGFANPLFYQNPRAFRDVTKGTNAIAANSHAGWAATQGWDACTGLGTPDFTSLLAVVKKHCGANRQ